MRLGQIGALVMAASAIASPGAALAAPGNGNSAATITGSFGASCTDFEAHSSKDISHVEIHYTDGRVIKDEAVDAPDISIDGGDEITSVIVKSGTTAHAFECANGPVAPCSDGIDNDGNGLIDFPADPGCGFPGDNDEGFD
jgi:hypothetical protein